MASVQKRGKRWEVRWVDSRGTHRSRSAPSRATAEELRRDIEHVQALGRDWTAESARQVPDLETEVGRYLADVARLRARSTTHIQAWQLGLFVEWLTSTIGRAPLVTDLSRQGLSDYWASLTGRATSTRIKYVSTVQQFWAWAAQVDEAAVVPFPRTIDMPKAEQTPTVAPTWEEMDACVLACREVWLYRLAFVLRFTGLRVQQAMRLTWADVDLTRATLTVRGELGKTDQEKAGRRIPISPHLVVELGTWGRREGWLVPDHRAGPAARLARPKAILRAWERAGVRKEAWKGQGYKGFRKGFVTGLRSLGAEPDAVEVLVGHSLGLRGRYTDPEALGLRKVADLVPPLERKVVQLDSARGRGV